MIQVTQIIYSTILKREAVQFTTQKWEEVNFFILFKAIISFDFRNIRANYKKIFFDYVKPKVVITMMSNYTSFYELKNQFQNITTIAIQTDLGDENFIRLLKETKKIIILVIISYFFQNFLEKKYQKYIKIKKNL